MRTSGLSAFGGLALCWVILGGSILFSPVKISAQNQEVLAADPFSSVIQEKVSSKELVKKAWAASGQKDINLLTDIVDQCAAQYGEQARIEQSSLSYFPERGKEKDYEALNDVATCFFVYGEALMHQGRSEEAKTLFRRVIDEYKWAQAWDPRGWYWSVAEKSQASIDVIMGIDVEEEEDLSRIQAKKTFPKIYFSGTNEVIDYTRYGEFVGVGKANYQYKMTDPKGLAEAVGEGIYPNTNGILKNPGYLEAKKDGRLEGNHWDFVLTQDLEAAYYKWATASEPWGIKLFYIGRIFEQAKMYLEAVKAYHAIVIHFPQSVGWTYWETPWYPAQAAIAKIKHIIRLHPELNLYTQWMKVEVKNGFDNDIRNDIFITYPGVVKKKSFWEKIKERFSFVPFMKSSGKVQKTIGGGNVRLVQYENGHWQILVNNKPFMIKGITYSPTQVGQSPDKGTLENWMLADQNKNGRIDGPFDSWIDKNRNNQKDAEEQIIGDFQLMKEMGVNTLRIFHHPHPPDKEFLRAMHEQYGFYVIMGDYLGKYTLGSGASWFEGTDYENPVHRENMLNSVKHMVMEFKDEPYLLMWVLGNENNYGVACNANEKPDAYYQFVNEAASWIKSVDRGHPVALGNGDTLFLDKFAQFSPAVDVFGANIYRGDYGFGSYWEQVYDATGKPAFVTEYGCPAYGKYLTLAEADQAQADYHRGNWLDIDTNRAGSQEGVGNALGGLIFEWLDEWWKNYEPNKHDKKAEAIGPFPGGYYYEEWFGVMSQGNGDNSPFVRQPRPSYFIYKELWN